MTDVCQDFGISRKTGYKIFDHYKEHGLSALGDRSRRPVHYANQLPQQVESLIVRLKAEKPHWGARKIRELLVRRLGGDVRIPAKSTIHAVLDRHGLVKRGGGRRHRVRGTPLSEGALPNDLWCADFKGEFKISSRRGASRQRIAHPIGQGAVVEAETIGRNSGVQGTPAWLLAQRLIEGLLPAAEYERLAQDGPPIAAMMRDAPQRDLARWGSFGIDEPVQVADCQSRCNTFIGTAEPESEESIGDLVCKRCHYCRGMKIRSKEV